MPSPGKFSVDRNFRGYLRPDQSSICDLDAPKQTSVTGNATLRAALSARQSPTPSKSGDGLCPNARGSLTSCQLSYGLGLSFSYLFTPGAAHHRRDSSRYVSITDPIKRFTVAHPRHRIHQVNRFLSPYSHFSGSVCSYTRCRSPHELTR